MVTIDSFELETFRRYHLNPEAVLRYRMRLACEAPADAKTLREYKRRLASFARKIAATHNGFVAKMGRIEQEMQGLNREMGAHSLAWDHPEDICLGAGKCWGPPCPDDGEYPMAFYLDLNRWGRGRSFENVSQCPRPLKPMYTERPDKEDALRAWNLFLIAFRAAPARMGRHAAYTYLDSDDSPAKTIPACYHAEYRDLNGEPLVIEETDIRLARPTAKAKTA
jgi:hypothetical protein